MHVTSVIHWTVRFHHCVLLLIFRRLSKLKKQKAGKKSAAEGSHGDRPSAQGSLPLSPHNRSQPNRTKPGATVAAVVAAELPELLLSGTQGQQAVGTQQAQHESHDNEAKQALSGEHGQQAQALSTGQAQEAQAAQHAQAAQQAQHAQGAQQAQQDSDGHQWLVKGQAPVSPDASAHAAKASHQSTSSGLHHADSADHAAEAGMETIGRCNDTLDRLNGSADVKAQAAADDISAYRFKVTTHY